MKFRISSFFATLATLPLFVLSSNAAVITWSSGDITGDSVVVTTGNVVEAANFNGSDVTINTVTFLGVDFTTGGSPTNLSGLTYNDISSSGDLGTGENIDTLANDTAFESGTSFQDANLTGLTSGVEYVVQFFVSHQGTATRSNIINDGNGNNVSVSHSGEFAIGTFTADATTQSLTFTNDDGGSQLWSGYQLRAIPEPSAALLGGLGMLALLRRRR